MVKPIPNLATNKMMPAVIIAELINSDSENPLWVSVKIVIIRETKPIINNPVATTMLIAFSNAPKFKHARRIISIPKAAPAVIIK